MADPCNSGRLPDGTFAPGNKLSRGRALGSRNRATAILDDIADGEAEGVLRSVLDAARGGDMRACELILSRTWPAKKGRPVHLALPAMQSAADVSAALGALVEAVAAGEVTPYEAAPVAAMLETRRKAIETADLEARIAALESREP